MASIHLPSYAKINLGLDIIGKRPDGFHDIETILYQIDLKDEITVSDAGHTGVAFSCNDATIPTGEANLCVRAAKALRESVGLRRGVKIHLLKSIPVGAGLGGGSSNAAVVLLALNKLWSLDLQPPQLEAVAAQLGSDVPFFITGGAMLASGRGETLEPFDFRSEMPIVIVYPGFQISTAWAYGRVNFDLTMKKKSINLSSFKGMKFKHLEFFDNIGNQLEQVVFPEYQNLAQIKSRMYEEKAVFSSMSGSGSVVFGIFENEDDALNVCNMFDGYRTFVARQVKWGFLEVN